MGGLATTAAAGALPCHAQGLLPLMPLLLISHARPGPPPPPPPPRRPAPAPAPAGSSDSQAPDATYCKSAAAGTAPWMDMEFFCPYGQPEVDSVRVTLR